VSWQFTSKDGACAGTAGVQAAAGSTRHRVDRSRTRCAPCLLAPRSPRSCSYSSAALSWGIRAALQALSPRCPCCGGRSATQPFSALHVRSDSTLEHA
jgi:hypothetical protein